MLVGTNFIRYLSGVELESISICFMYKSSEYSHRNEGQETDQFRLSSLSQSFSVNCLYYSFN